MGPTLNAEARKCDSRLKPDVEGPLSKYLYVRSASPAVADALGKPTLAKNAAGCGSRRLHPSVTWGSARWPKVLVQTHPLATAARGAFPCRNGASASYTAFASTKAPGVSECTQIQSARIVMSLPLVERVLPSRPARTARLTASAVSLA